MKHFRLRQVAFAAAITTAAPLSAQTVATVVQSVALPDSLTSGTSTKASHAVDSTSTAAILPLIQIQRIRPRDQRGVNVFEAPKEDTLPFTNLTIGLGAAFTRQFQGLEHGNTAALNVVNGVDANQLIRIGHGFNNAVANLYVDAQLAKGMRVEVTTYLSSRHHQNTWVKDGYLLVDASPIDIDVLNNIMKYVTLKVGDFEVDYGDEHYRRTDNGLAIYNPFVGNYIMDAFTTEIGGEAYVRANGFLAMAGVTGGEIHGQVTAPQKRSPTFLGKLGFDRQLNSDLRVRLTGSVYGTSRSVNNTLYSGDRAGSRYYDVLQNTTSTEDAQAWSGSIQPGQSSKLTAVVINPFVKYRGFEFFGNAEQAKGRAVTEITDRTWRQYAGEGVYRFLNDRLYAGGRYNVVKGSFLGIPNDVTVNRTQVSGGWFVTPTVLLKGEYVVQNYNDFPVTDIRNGGRIKGFVVEGTVSF
ncbi:MAG: hypothetical protein ACR2MQ_11385 [Gemmatimonadaceae bacterium]